MELKNNEKLQILATKSLDLHDRINDKINEQGFIFCSRCSNHGLRYCLADGSSNPDEMEKMMAIRDSLKQLHHVITSLQKLRSSHERQRDEALARVQESRKVLIERVIRCSDKLDVYEEVIQFSLNLKYWEMDHEKKKKNVNGILSFLVRTMRFGLEFGVIFATIYYTSVKLQYFKRSRQHSRILQRSEKPGFLLPDSDLHLDVLCGRG